ncbi:MAG: hypothetical protein DRI57_29975 [Deltaproteobacteria bacterium]|nr:MAG: hypothetical protein DRI57_29975 [Deltaproteobacteria bacterium]
MSGIIHSIIKVAIIVFSVLGIIAQVQAEPLRVRFFGNPPHVVSDHQDGAKGPAVEYFRLIAKKMGITDVVFKELPMARLLSYLEKGKSDAAIILAKAPGRAGMFAYPKEPYFSIRSAIVVDHSNPLREIKSLDDLLPLRIAVYAKAYLSPIMRDKRLKITPLYEADVNDVAYGLLLHKRIDAFYSPIPYGLH